jgi:hypothetical protein
MQHPLTLGPACDADLNDERELSTATRLACGGIAGTTGQTVAYPLDVVRRRMQVAFPPCCSFHQLAPVLFRMTPGFVRHAVLLAL